MDESAAEFVSLWTQYQPEVRRYVALLLPHPNDADDVIQQTATRLWEKFDQYDSQRPFVAWAIRFAYHEVLSWRQRQARERLVFSEDLIAQLHQTFGDEASKQPELDRLLARFVDGKSAPEDIDALQRMLDGNPDAQRRYIHYVDLHAELRQRSLEPMAASDGVERRGLFTRRPNLAIIAVLAAAILIAVGMGIGRWPGLSTDDVANEVAISVDEQTDDGVAVLRHAAAVKWLGENAPRLGEIVSPGNLSLSEGLIELEFYNGVQLLVEGPADLQIQSVSNVVCRMGKLRSLVPANATGFSVMTPKFELVDLGTEFAIDIGSDGRADVHVFDGEVELYLPDGKRKPENRQVLLGGNAMAWSTEGTKTTQAAGLDTFPSFEEIRIREQTDSQERYELWRQWNGTLREDPRIVARYDFESGGATLVDNSNTKADGTIIGCQWTSGRWPDKRALEFKRPGDRVRIDVPGEFDSLTVCAWVRLDALPARRQSLLLTDGYEVERLHWQVGPEGELRIGGRISSTQRPRQRNTGYASPPVFTPRQIGVWSFVCSTYDRPSQTVTHWFNGKQVFVKSLAFDQPLRIGISEIGNWGVPHRPKHRAIRNLIGRMDEMTIWSVALNEQQITEIYEKSRP